jgi:hypothetical protein
VREEYIVELQVEIFRRVDSGKHDASSNNKENKEWVAFEGTSKIQGNVIFVKVQLRRSKPGQKDSSSIPLLGNLFW